MFLIILFLTHKTFLLKPSRSRRYFSCELIQCKIQTKYIKSLKQILSLSVTCIHHYMQSWKKHTKKVWDFVKWLHPIKFIQINYKIQTMIQKWTWFCSFKVHYNKHFNLPTLIKRISKYYWIFTVLKSLPNFS